MTQPVLNRRQNNATYENMEGRTAKQYKTLAKRDFVLERNELKKHAIKRGETVDTIAEKFGVPRVTVRRALLKAGAQNNDGRPRVGKIISIRTGKTGALRFYRKVTSTPNPRRGFRGGVSRRVSIRCGELSRRQILDQIKRMTGQNANAVAYVETRKLMAPPFAGRRNPRVLETEPVERRLKDLGIGDLCTWARKVATSMQKVQNRNLFKYKKINHWGTKTQINLRNNLDANAREQMQLKRRKERRKRLKQYRDQAEFKKRRNMSYKKYLRRIRFPA